MGFQIMELFGMASWIDKIPSTSPTLAFIDASPINLCCSKFQKTTTNQPKQNLQLG